MITILRWLLLPFSFLYQAVIILRNFLFDKKILKSKSYQIPTLIIGNLAVGGAGKSPMTEYLIRLLINEYKIATLSRGYGRKSKGFRPVELTSTVKEVGDEPLQFKRKFPQIGVFVNENRCEGIERIQQHCDLILLDDAFQHRKLKPGLSILLFDYNSLLSPILMLPTGNFRDTLSSSKRADIIVITKCPDVVPIQHTTRIEGLLRPYYNKSIFYSKISYGRPINILNNLRIVTLENIDILLVCGIANPTPLIEYLQSYNNTVELISYPDHHNYSEKDYQYIIDKYHSTKKDGRIILTTEKDMQRIDKTYFSDLPLHYIPIKMEFLNGAQQDFDMLIKSYISIHLN